MGRDDGIRPRRIVTNYASNSEVKTRDKTCSRNPILRHHHQFPHINGLKPSEETFITVPNLKATRSPVPFCRT